MSPRESKGIFWLPRLNHVVRNLPLDEFEYERICGRTRAKKSPLEHGDFILVVEEVQPEIEKVSEAYGLSDRVSL